MKNKYGINLYFNTIILLIITLFSIGLTSSNKTNEIKENVSLVNILSKTAGESTAKVLEQAKTVPKEEVKVEKKEEVKEDTKKVEEKKASTTTKKTTTTTKKSTTTTKKTTTTQSSTEKNQETTVRKDKYGKEVGSISISGSNFKKDLVSDDGSYYYLDHTLAGKLNYRGVPFIDNRTNFNGKKTIIYSHSAKDGSAPFNFLQNYNGNKSFYDAHKYITINYGGKTYKYLIFSAYVSIANSDSDEGLEYFRVMNYSDEKWEAKLQEYKSKSDYNTGVSVSKNDKILILQTCSMDKRYYKKYYRYNQLVMAKLISVS